MVPGYFYIPIAIYGVAALLLMWFGRTHGGLYGLLLASYCGVMLVTFTRGASGAIYLSEILVVLVAMRALSRPTLPAYGSRAPVTLLYILLAVFFFGIGVAYLRFNVGLEAEKAGTFQVFGGGIPLSVLMACYRVFVLCSLVLAFTIPMRYWVDRDVLGRCLIICWLGTLSLAFANLVTATGIFSMEFTTRTLIEGREHLAVGNSGAMGFTRAGNGMILVYGLFMSYAMTQVVRSSIVRTLAWILAPFMMVALLFSWSRAATLAMAVSSISLIITLGGARAIRGVILTIFGLAVIWGVLGRFPDVAQRMDFFFTGHVDESGMSRITTWTLLLGYLTAHPDVLLLGTGFQNFHYFMNLGQEAVNLEAAHNNYLHVLTEFGIPGLVVFLSWLAAMFVWLWKWRQGADNVTRVLTGVFMSVMVAIVVSALTQETMAPAPAMTTEILHFYLLFGIWVSWYRTEMWQKEYAAHYAHWQAWQALQQQQAAEVKLTPGTA